MHLHLLLSETKSEQNTTKITGGGHFKRWAVCLFGYFPVPFEGMSKITMSQVLAFISLKKSYLLLVKA